MRLTNSFIVAGLLIFCSVISYGQYEIPVIRKMSQPKQNAGKPIIYQFPDTVNNIIDNYIKIVQDSSSYFYIRLDASDNGYKIFVSDIPRSALADTTSSIVFLLSSSHRYTIVGNRKLPIYLNSDLEFGFYNFAFTGRALDINLKRERNRMFKVESVHYGE